MTFTLYLLIGLIVWTIIGVMAGLAEESLWMDNTELAVFVFVMGMLSLAAWPVLLPFLVISTFAVKLHEMRKSDAE